MDLRTRKLTNSVIYKRGATTHKNWSVTKKIEKMATVNMYLTLSGDQLSEKRQDEKKFPIDVCK